MVTKFGEQSIGIWGIAGIFTWIIRNAVAVSTLYEGIFANLSSRSTDIAATM